MGATLISSSTKPDLQLNYRALNWIINWKLIEILQPRIYRRSHIAIYTGKKGWEAERASPYTYVPHWEARGISQLQNFFPPGAWGVSTLFRDPQPRTTEIKRGAPIASDGENQWGFRLPGRKRSWLETQTLMSQGWKLLLLQYQPGECTVWSVNYWQYHPAIMVCCIMLCWLYTTRTFAALIFWRSS